VNRIDSNPAAHSIEREVLEARFGLRVAARLWEAAEASPPGVDERLRFAREQALQRAREVGQRVAEVHAVPMGAGVFALKSSRSFEGSWWLKLAAVLPLAVLVLGLLEIHDLHDRSEIDAAAQIDAELLADDLPPDAYRDPGFVEFLKAPLRD
jgi:hypothetical protein